MIARTAYRLAFVVARAVLDAGAEKSKTDTLASADNGPEARGEAKLAVGRCYPLRCEDRADQAPATQERAGNG